MAPFVQPSEAEKQRRRIVGVNAETVTDVGSTDFPGHYPGEDHSWDAEKFADTFQVNFHKNEKFNSSFSLVGIDAAVANAFRRIMIAEIPTVAIEYCFVMNNTSIIQDEVLCQRIGLVPFKGSPQGIREWLKWYKKPAEDAPKDDQFNTCFDYNTIRLTLNVECTRNPDAARGETDPHKAYHNAHVYAKDIKYEPFGRQHKYFSGEGAIAPAYPDILIAKMRPGQCIDIEMHAIKGVGSDHAKFSPVATASYRLLPVINITKPILGKDAEKFARCFPRGVIGLETVSEKEAKAGTPYEGHAGEKKAVVLDAMKDTVSRECLRHEEFKDKVKLGRIRDHFIFSVESTGQWESDELFLESINLLKAKCQKLKSALDDMNV
ncbi:putative DNA-directed RNA polymerase [Coleophoma crateriformis]|uniref:DNA-directed RNA polymerases I and III subunit RPAC1 n=1 Tax=Coleophoma crateriformis TaxID=565419 RepID=A0A3D8RVT4_9HELO|nr:putative DNA-directed RNA polymerase [Coleophoma crateriformis]